MTNKWGLIAFHSIPSCGRPRFVKDRPISPPRCSQRQRENVLRLPDFQNHSQTDNETQTSLLDSLIISFSELDYYDQDGNLLDGDDDDDDDLDKRKKRRNR